MVDLPCLIDCHVHFREPGLEHKATMRSESEAAYYGGISAVCDMPNTMPPTQSIAALADKVQRSASIAHSRCRIFFYFGATAHTHLAELEQLWTDPAHADLRAHCCGLKLYLDNSTGDLRCDKDVTRAAFALCGRLRIPLVAHCEHSDTNAAAAAMVAYTGPASHSLRRPPDSEVRSIREAIALAQEHHTPLHIAHLSTEGGLAAVREARAQWPELSLTCEVAPHHLFLSPEDYACGQSRVKVNPPLRPRRNVEALWRGVLDGTVDCIATDHAPHTRAEKGLDGNDDAADNHHRDNNSTAEAGQRANRDTTKAVVVVAPSGMPGVEVVVALLLTVVSGRWPHPTETVMPEALQHGRLTLSDVVRLMHTRPMEIFNLPLTSTPGRRFDLTKCWTVEGAKLHSLCGWSPYEGWQLVGKAVSDDVTK